jgi:MFS transporter, PAT family, beta-lactamase induction signal transducer AmpG
MHNESSGGQVIHERERAWIFGLLIAPSAVAMYGIIQGGVLSYLLSVQGVGSGMQSHLIGLFALPTSLYFLWSPLTDFFVRRRTWLLAGGMFAAGLRLFCFERPKLTSASAMMLMFLSDCCSRPAWPNLDFSSGRPRPARERQLPVQRLSRQVPSGD